MIMASIDVLLDDDEQIFRVRRDHDLVLVASNAEEGELVPDHLKRARRSSLSWLIVRESRVRLRLVVVEVRPDGHAVRGDNEHALDAAVGLDPFEGLLDLGRHGGGPKAACPLTAPGPWRWYCFLLARLENQLHRDVLRQRGCPEIDYPADAFGFARRWTIIISVERH